MPRRRVPLRSRLILALAVSLAVGMAGSACSDGSGGASASGREATSSTNPGSPVTDQASASGEEVDAPPAPDPETAETGDVDAIAGADSGVDLSDRDPCSLLDPATIEATVGAPVAEGTIADLRCTWSGADDPALVVAVVVPINTAGSVDEHCQQLREFDEKLTAVAEVEGLGNRAWAHLVPAGGAGGQVAESAVTACTEAGVVIVGLVATLDEATLQAANQALASEALGRI